MCLILFAYQRHPRYPLILVANRDEFYERPAQALEFWPDQPDVAAGRDLKRMGTWMGINRKGGLAAVTNYREPGLQKPEARSRGHLVADFLAGRPATLRYLHELHANGNLFNGFNLIIGDARELYYYSNRDGSPSPLQPGIHGLSNRLLNTPWPKVRNGKFKLTTILAGDENDIDRQRLIEMLQDQSIPPDSQLPDTGVGQTWERILAPIFITSPAYGTRCSSLITIDTGGEVDFTEITWHPAKARPNAMGVKRIRFKIY